MADRPVVLCYGDSNTHGADPVTGERLGRGARWPGLLSGLLADEAQVIEEGLNGRTTARDDPYTPGRNGMTYLVPCLASHAPIDVLVVMLGTNDLKVTYGLSPSDIGAAASRLVDVALHSGCGPGGGPPSVLLMAPPALGEPTVLMEMWGFAGARERNRELPRFYRAAAERLGVSFLDASAIVTADPADGVHLSAEGHAALAEAVAAVIRPMLGSA